MDRSTDTSFSRKTRTQLHSVMPSKETSLLERIIQDLNNHTYSKYLQDDIVVKDGIESENVSDGEDLYSDETKKFELPSSDTAAYNINAGNGPHAFGISDQSATKIQGWKEQNNQEASRFLNYVNPQLLHPSKITNDGVNFSDYFNIY